MAMGAAQVARANEAAFFRSIPAYAGAHNVGTAHLAAKLERQFISAIQAQLPVIRSSIDNGRVALNYAGNLKRVMKLRVEVDCPGEAAHYFKNEAMHTQRPSSMALSTQGGVSTMSGQHLCMLEFH